MNKIKVTKKHFKDDLVMGLGYCQGQFLLNYKEPIAYSCGSYGWSCDYYKLKDIIISSGYSYIGKSLDYEVVRKYENQAREIVYNHNLDYEVKKTLVNDLLNEVIELFKDKHNRY